VNREVIKQPPSLLKNYCAAEAGAVVACASDATVPVDAAEALFMVSVAATGSLDTSSFLEQATKDKAIKEAAKRFKKRLIKYLLKE
jgi:hypothetical protein